MKSSFNFQKQKNIRGFTLVELLVSMAIFMFVITIAAGSLFSAQSVNTKLEQTQLILDGVNLATEVMARDIRYGTTFYCDSEIPQNVVRLTRKSCPMNGGGGALTFKPSVAFPGSAIPSNDRKAYYLLNGVVYRDEYKEGNINNKVSYQITPADVNVKTLKFFVVGAEESSATTLDLIQPLVTVIISGVTVPEKSNIKPVQFTIQTSISSRPIDI